MEDGREVRIKVVMQYKKSNALINAFGKTSLNALRICAVSMRYIEHDEENIATSVIPVGIIKKIIGSNSNSLYATASEIKNTHPILNWRVLIKCRDSQYRLCDVISDAEYDDGILAITYNKELTDQIIDLKSEYTTFNLEEALSLPTAYAMHLYEILKSEYDYARATRKGIKELPFKWTVNLTELKLRLGILELSKIEDNSELLNEIMKEKKNWRKIQSILDRCDISSYKAGYKDIKIKILKKAIDNINLLTSLNVSFVGKRFGRKINEIEFTISQKSMNNIEKPNIEQEKRTVPVEIERLLEPYRLSAKDIDTIAKTAGYDIEKIKRACEVAEDQKSIVNFTGFMIRAIEQNYEPKSGSKKLKNSETYKNEAGQTVYMSQHGIEERVYDFDELEKRFSKN